MAGINSGPNPVNGALMFIDAGELGLLTQAEHDGCTAVEWDPTGRYVISAASSAFQKVGPLLWLPRPLISVCRKSAGSTCGRALVGRCNAS